jgi:hypothetical protein
MAGQVRVAGNVPYQFDDLVREVIAFGLTNLLPCAKSDDSRAALQ